MKPVRWLQASTRYGANLSPAPNFAYEFCLRRITSEQRVSLDLSSWNVAFNGAERIDPRTLDEFTEIFGPCGFRRQAFFPCYGLAESTLLATCGRDDEEPRVTAFAFEALARGEAVPDSDGRKLVSCGRACEALEVQIVDPASLDARPEGCLGEVWISGPSVAAGYLQNETATTQTFAARLNDPGSGSWMRTGDLGFFWEGDLYVTGRLKDQIIVAGRNLASEDVELSVESAHPAIISGASVAFAVEDLRASGW